MSGDTHLLPACQKCKVRKVKCDRAGPKCGNCTKGSVACIIIDPVTGQQYARGYISQLEEQEAELKAKVGERLSERRESRDAATVRSAADLQDRPDRYRGRLQEEAMHRTQDLLAMAVDLDFCIASCLSQNGSITVHAS